MNLNDRVLYRLQISGIDKSDIAIVAGQLGISQSQMILGTDTIIIPRLNTIWRGNDVEQAWQDELRKSVGDKGTVLFDVQPWSHADGYPKGEVEL